MRLDLVQRDSTRIMLDQKEKGVAAMVPITDIALLRGIEDRSWHMIGATSSSR